MKKKNNGKKVTRFYVSTYPCTSTTDGNHDFDYIIFRFKTIYSARPYIDRFVKKCIHCGKYYLDKDKMKELKKITKGYMFISSDNGNNTPKKKVVKNLQRNDEQKRVRVTRKNKLTIYGVKDYKKHECIGKINIKMVELKNKDQTIKVEVAKCTGCKKYYCNTNETDKLEQLKNYVHIVDYEAEKKSKEIDDYIRNNPDLFIAKEEHRHFDSKNISDMSNTNFYNILNKIKRNNKYDFIIKGHTYYCTSNNHNVFEIDADIDVCDIVGNIKKNTVSAWYCENCNVFYIYENEYNRIRASGVPLCKIYDMYKFVENNNSFQLNSESVMHSFGYNVNSIDNITKVQRQTILSNIIDNNIMKKSEVLNHLRYLYNRSPKIKSFNQARSRWNDDIVFVSNYNHNPLTKVCVNSILKINYIRK